MITDMTDTKFERIVEATKTEMARRQYQDAPGNSQGSAFPQANAVQTYGTRRGRDFRGGRGARGSFLFRGRGGHGRGSRGRGYSQAGLSRSNPGACYYCGKTGHFIAFCRNKMQDEAAGRVRKPRGRGGYRQNRGAYRSNWNQSYLWGQAKQVDDEDPPLSEPNCNKFPNFRDPHSEDRPGVNNLIVRFKSSLAIVDESKKQTALIDSGATHNFCWDKIHFTNYIPVTEETVAAAFGSGTILGRGNIKVPLLNGVEVEAFHTPQFLSHIISVSYVKKICNVLFADNFKNQSGCFMLDPETWDIANYIPEKNGLYELDMTGVEKPCLVQAKTINREENKDALLRHSKTGHPRPERYLKLSNTVAGVSHFHIDVLRDIVCIPCITGKTKKASVKPAEMKVTRPLELVHFELSGPRKLKTITGEQYVAHFLDSFTGKSKAVLLSNKANLAELFQEYKMRAENHFSSENFKLIAIRCDNAGENRGEVKGIESFCSKSGILYNASPAYAPESNGSAERAVQENWKISRILRHGAPHVPEEQWGEAIRHADWLRNRLPSKRIGDELPIHGWSYTAQVDFRVVPNWGQQGFTFIYRYGTTSNKKFLMRTQAAVFVGMKSEARLVKVYIPAMKKIREVRRQDFKPLHESKLPGISTLLDGIARQAALEEKELDDEQQFAAQAHLIHCLTALYQQSPDLGLPDHAASKAKVSKSFRQACQSQKWAAAIDREYNALVDRQTWTYVDPTSGINVIDFTWTFRIKLLDPTGKGYLLQSTVLRSGRSSERDG